MFDGHFLDIASTGEVLLLHRASGNVELYGRKVSNSNLFCIGESLLEYIHAGV